MSGFVNILFLIFARGDKIKNCFIICEYTFLTFGKEDKRKNSARFFKICKYSFLIFEKGDQRKSCVSFCKYPFSIFEKRG